MSPDRRGFRKVRALVGQFATRKSDPDVYKWVEDWQWADTFDTYQWIIDFRRRRDEQKAAAAQAAAAELAPTL